VNVPAAALAPSESPVRRFVRSGWLPAAVVVAVASLVVVAYGVDPGDVARFGAYIVLVIAVPGLLWVRLLRRGPGHIAEDVGLGLALGYCINVAVYIVVRWIGVPQLVIAWAIVTYLVFAHPRLRRHFRSGGVRAPAAWSWALAAIFGFILVYSAGAFYAQQHLTGTDTPYVDLPFHLALVGELRNHMPPMVPYVSGLDLAYHWFFYADTAATSWVTGIEPVTLLYRLSMLPMIGAFIVLTASTARRLAPGWWTGPLAVAIALVGVTAAPYHWLAMAVFDTEGLPAIWWSPTNTFAMALFAALTLCLIDLFRATSRSRRGAFILVAILVFGAAAAKATVLPLTIAGLLAVVIGRWIVTRRFDRDALIAMGIAVAGFAGSLVLIFQGSAGGAQIGASALQSFPIASSVGARAVTGGGSLVVAVVTFVIAFVLWTFLWAGALGLARRGRELLSDGSILFLIGICVAGLGAVLVLLYPGLSQVYFLRAAAGAFGLLTAAGIAHLVPRSLDRSTVVAVLVAAVLGAVIVTVLTLVGPARAPLLGRTRLLVILFWLALPIALLCLATVVTWFVARRLDVRRPALRGAAPLIVVALVFGFSIPPLVAVLTYPFSAPATSGAAIPADGITAARWLRDHSSPADLTATNLHCIPVPSQPGVCDPRHFWVSAFAERRMLVEGWEYTTPASAYSATHRRRDRSLPFWNQPILDANDAAFATPTPATVDRLRQLGVRWLFADTSTADAAALGRLATLRYQAGDFGVFELT
jgi:hypothetical protein